jgi:hypothetical protein
MSETIGHHAGHHAGHAGAVREAYAFVCISCGYGWERSFDIEHHTDVENHPYVIYVCEGKRVPSPLTRPTCENCEGHKVRIMRSGQVADVAAIPETGIGPRTRGWSPLHLLHWRRAS